MPDISIQGIFFPVPERFAEGHVLTALEAAALNQTLYENLANNFSGKVKKAKKELGETPTDAQLKPLREEFDAYQREYTFRGKALAKTAQDPISKLAFKLAKEKVLEALRKKGIDPKTLAEGRVDELANQYALENPAFRAEAKRRIDAMQSMSETVLEL